MGLSKLNALATGVYNEQLQALHELLDSIMPTLKYLKELAKKGHRSYDIITLNTPCGYRVDGIKYHLNGEDMKEIVLNKTTFTVAYQKKVLDTHNKTISYKYIVNYILNKSISEIGKPKHVVINSGYFTECHILQYKW